MYRRKIQTLRMRYQISANHVCAASSRVDGLQCHPVNAASATRSDLRITPDSFSSEVAPCQSANRRKWGLNHRGVTPSECKYIGLYSSACCCPHSFITLLVYGVCLSVDATTAST